MWLLQPLRRRAAGARRAPVAVRRRRLARLAGGARPVAGLRAACSRRRTRPRARARPARARLGRRARPPWRARACGRRCCSAALLAALAGVVRVLLARRRIAARGGAGERRSARAARSPTPVRARSAARSRRCGDDAPHRTRRVRAALRALSTVLIVSGTLLLADAGATLLWQEPVSAVYAALPAGRAGGRARPAGRVAAAGRAARAREAARPAPAARVRRPLAGPPDRRGRRRSAGCGSTAIGVSQVVVEGTDAGDLRAGPGHYPETPLPGQRGTVGDRRAPHDLRRAVPQDRQGPARATRSCVTMPYGRFTYRVERTRIVPPTASGSPNACPTID